MRTRPMRFLAVLAIFGLLTACSDGDDDTVRPAPKPPARPRPTGRSGPGPQAHGPTGVQGGTSAKPIGRRRDQRPPTERRQETDQQ